MEEWMVLGTGLFAIGWVNAYFFGRRPSTEARRSSGGTQEATITVRGGYSPAVVKATKGSTLRLVFDRQETSGCSEEVVFPDFGIRTFLPAWEQTTVEILPTEAGTFAFTCGMGMLQGRVEVE